MNQFLVNSQSVLNKKKKKNHTLKGFIHLKKKIESKELVHVEPSWKIQHSKI